MRSSIIAKLHRRHVASQKWNKQQKLSGDRDCTAKCERNQKTARVTEPQVRTFEHKYRTRNKYNMELLSEPNQEIQLDFAGPIKPRTRADLYILVAVDHFSKWPTPHTCEGTDTRTVLNFLAKYCSDNGTPRRVRTDNGSCFKNKDFRKICDGEHIDRIPCTPNLRTGTGLVERTIRTIRSLKGANLQDGYIFEESVQLAIKTTRQMLLHNRLKMTPFQLHLRRKPRTAITNLNGQPECLLSIWKKILTKYFSAQPTEL